MLFCAFPQAINAMQSFAARGLYPTHTAIPDSGLWGSWFWWGGRDHGIIIKIRGCGLWFSLLGAFQRVFLEPPKANFKIPQNVWLPPFASSNQLQRSTWGCQSRPPIWEGKNPPEASPFHFSQHKTADHIHKYFHYNYIWISLIIQDKYIFTFHDFHFHCLRMRALASARDFPPPAKMLKLVSSSSAVKQCRQTRWSNNTKVVHWRALIVEPLSISSCSLFSDSIRRWRCGARYWVDSLSPKERPLSIFLWTGVIWSPWIRHSIEIF